MIWILIVFLALLPRALAQFAILKWRSRHGTILLVWAAFSLGFVPYVLFPPLREAIAFPRMADVAYFGLFIALAMHFEWKFGQKVKDDETD